MFHSYSYSLFIIVTVIITSSSYPSFFLCFYLKLFWHLTVNIVWICINNDQIESTNDFVAIGWWHIQKKSQYLIDISFQYYFVLSEIFCSVLAIAPVKTPVIFISATSRIITFLTTWIRTRVYTGRIFRFATVSPEAIRTPEMSQENSPGTTHRWQDTQISHNEKRKKKKTKEKIWRKRNELVYV